MKRILCKYVKNLYLLDEYNTSKISNENYKLYGNKEKEEQYLTTNLSLELISTWCSAFCLSIYISSFSFLNFGFLQAS